LDCETRIHDTSYPSGGHRLVGPAWVSDLNRLRSFGRPLSGPFDGLTRSDLGRIEPLPLAWSGDRFRRQGVIGGWWGNSAYCPALQSGWALL